MSTESLLRQTRLLVAAIAISMLSLGAIVGFGWSQHQASRRDHTIIVGVRDGGASQKLQAAHSDCRGTRSSVLDAARWHILFSIPDTATQAELHAAKAKGLALPNIDELTNKGGVIDGTRYGPCPPSIAPKKASTTTTTGKTRA